MRTIRAAGLLALCGFMACAPVGPFRGNDTGGIIAFTMANEADARQLAVAHCASYGKVARFLANDAQYGGYLSFACRWVPYGTDERPLQTRN
jgi:hypothetical protein